MTEFSFFWVDLSFNPPPPVSEMEQKSVTLLEIKTRWTTFHCDFKSLLMFLRFKRKSSQLFVVFNCAAAADLKSAIPPSLWRNSPPCADLVCLHLCHPATCGPDVLEAKKKKKPCWVSENNFRADNCTELCKVEPAGQKGGACCSVSQQILFQTRRSCFFNLVLCGKTQRSATLSSV